MPLTKRHPQWQLMDANGVSVDADGADVKISVAFRQETRLLTIAELAWHIRFLRGVDAASARLPVQREV